MRTVVFCLWLGLAATFSIQTAVAQNNAPPYEGSLMRLSELMGALHYLRGLCGAPEAGEWRNKMSALIEGGNADMARRERLAGAFNRGYRTYEQTYRVCNASAVAVIKAYLAESARIARDMTARYGQ